MLLNDSHEIEGNTHKVLSLSFYIPKVGYYNSSLRFLLLLLVGWL
jgi:hypothetical protein